MRKQIEARKYSVHKIFGPTIQGEGGMTGVVSHFIRLSGCNMWDGRPETRAESQCPFCDTDFLSHTMMTAEEILRSLEKMGTFDYIDPEDSRRSARWVTISGGEPLLQVDAELCKLLACDYYIAIETNGTVDIDPELRRWVDYVTMSPKVERQDIALSKADCVKLLWPPQNPNICPDAFYDFNARDFFLQPIDTGDTVQSQMNVKLTVEELYDLAQMTYSKGLEGRWRLSLQTHKILDVE